MHVKVTFGEDKIVIPLKNTKAMTISKLVEQIRAKFAKEHGKHNLYIPLLTTIDHYVFCGDDFVEDVILDGATIIAVTPDQFRIKNQRKDLKTGVTRKITVGLHDHNKIFVTVQPIDGKSDHVKMFLLESDKFNGSTVCTAPIIGTVQDDENGTWFLEVRFWLNEKKTIQGIETHVKTASDKQNCVDGIMIGVNKIGTLVKGNIVHLKGGDNDEEEDDTVYELPDPERKGPNHPIETNASVNPQTRYGRSELHARALLTTELTSTDMDLLPISNAPIDLSWDVQGKIFTNQDYWRAGNGEFSSVIEFQNVIVTNKKLEKTYIAKISAYLMNSNRKWESCNTTLLGFLDKNTGRFSFKEQTGFVLDNGESMSIALSARILKSGKMSPDPQRIHPLLSPPLHIKFEFSDMEGNVSSQIFQVTNPVKTYPTHPTIMESEGIKHVDFVYCDNTDMDHRIWVAIFKRDNKIEIKFSKGLSFVWSKTMIDTLAFNAIEAKENEFMLKGFSIVDEYGNSFKGWLVVDLKKEKPYAFKFELTTSTSSVIQYVPLPKFSVPMKGLKPYTLSISPSVIRVGDEIEVTFNVQNHVPKASDCITLYQEGTTSAIHSLLHIYNSQAQKYGMVILKIPYNSTQIPPDMYQIKYRDSNNNILCTSEPFSIDKE